LTPRQFQFNNSHYKKWLLFSTMRLLLQAVGRMGNAHRETREESFQVY